VSCDSPINTSQNSHPRGGGEQEIFPIIFTIKTTFSKAKHSQEHHIFYTSISSNESTIVFIC